MLVTGFLRKDIKIFVFAILTVFLVALCSGCPDKDTGKPNILFICVDDLRPELGCYGRDYINSPNIDRLAESGVAFTQHFAQFGKNLFNKTVTIQ